MIPRMLRYRLASLLPTLFARLYSAVDNPTEVPVQAAAYRLATRKYLGRGDRVLDVGFGLGYGLRIMAEKAGELRGIEVDRRAVRRVQGLASDITQLCEVRHYDGHTIPYDSGYFDVVTCIDVIEHIPDYEHAIEDMIRVSKRVVLLSTPNRRPENTRPDGRPKNYWHLREWTYEELDAILRIPSVRVKWNFLNGPADGPYECSSVLSVDTMALAPALMLAAPQSGGK